MAGSGRLASGVLCSCLLLVLAAREAVATCDQDYLDSYCQTLNNDPASCCKTYQDPPVCMGGDQPCFCPPTTTTTPEPECTQEDQDAYCQKLNDDPASCCKTYQFPPVCMGGDQPCGCPLPEVTTTTTTTTTTTEEEECSQETLDMYCQQLNSDPASCCKSYQNPPVCMGGDQPCQCPKKTTTTTAAPECTQDTLDAYCQELNDDPASCCKTYQFPPVCMGGDQPCSC